MDRRGGQPTDLHNHAVVRIDLQNDVRNRPDLRDRRAVHHGWWPVKVGVVGASGYAGTELLRLCAGHPDLEVAAATAGGHAGSSVAAHTPALAAAYPSLHYAPSDPAELDGLDLVFLALPHGESQHLVPELVDRVGAVVDLAADFRLTDPGLYPTWYGETHSAPGLVEAGVISVDDGSGPVPALVVDAASGVSGAGRAPKDHLSFGSVDEDFVAYGLLDHRHTAEMEQGLGTPVLFTPHLAPMTRGILATCYARPSVPAEALTTEAALAVLRRRYAGEPFVVVTDEPPSTKATRGSNCAHVTVRVDPRTGWIVALAAIDNLVKGAAGQAVQCANLALGLPETTGLPMVGVYP